MIMLRIRELVGERVKPEVKAKVDAEKLVQRFKTNKALQERRTRRGENLRVVALRELLLLNILASFCLLLGYTEYVSVRKANFKRLLDRIGAR